MPADPPPVAWLPLPGDDHALCLYDARRGAWVILEGRPAGDVGPDRVADLIKLVPETPDV